MTGDEETTALVPEAEAPNDPRVLPSGNMTSSPREVPSMHVTVEPLAKKLGEKPEMGLDPTGAESGVSGPRNGRGRDRERRAPVPGPGVGETGDDPIAAREAQGVPEVPVPPAPHEVGPAADGGQRDEGEEGEGGERDPCKYMSTLFFSTKEAGMKETQSIEGSKDKTFSQSNQMAGISGKIMVEFLALILLALK